MGTFNEFGKARVSGTVSLSQRFSCPGKVDYTSPIFPDKQAYWLCTLLEMRGARYRDGTLTRGGMKHLMMPIREEIEGLLLRGVFSGNECLMGMCNELCDHRRWLVPGAFRPNPSTPRPARQPLNRG